MHTCMSQGSTSYPFKKVLFANIGDCHAMGQRPITFVRQVLAAGVLPELMSKDLFPSDVIERARAVLGSASGQSLGLLQVTVSERMCWPCGLVGYSACLVNRRSPVRIRSGPYF